MRTLGDRAGSEWRRLSAADLCGWAPQCKSSDGNSTSVSLTCSLCSFGTCAGSWCVGNQRPCQSSGRATVQSADTLSLPPTRAHSNQDGVRDGDRGSTRVGETPGKRVGARGRGRGRARGWHTRVTARLRQGGQTYRQRRQGEGKWEGRQAREGAQGSGTGVARRRAGGTRSARGSSGEREHGTKKNKKTAEQADTQDGHIEEAGRGRWGEQGANIGTKKHNVSH